MDRKGFEISVSMLVVLILSTVVFAGGLYMVKQYFTLATQVQAQIDADTTRQINAKLLEGTEKVVIPIHKKTARGGQVVTFGMGVLNTLGAEHTFGIDVSFANAYDKDTEESIEVATEGQARPEQKYINNNWLPQEFTKDNQFTLAPNARQVIPIPIKVDNRMSDTESTRRATTYVFNVCVFKSDDSSQQIGCGEEQFSPIELALLHGGKILKVYVVVD
ncbi:hypothetical protein HY641_05040 [Candidatus Woesearchaeota archaeon]|nr:hypothetical protein [Candidatus Woesearchaeota archaeon]